MSYGDHYVRYNEQADFTGVTMRTILEFLSLSDRYERKARLLPAFIVAAPLAITTLLAVPHLFDWTKGLIGGAALEVILGMVLGLLARVRGKATEDRLWKEWGGPPTTRLLRPDSTESSEEVRVRWRAAIKELTGMRLPASRSDEKMPGEIDQLIGDAVRQLRYVLRDRPEARILTVHNEDYGFARNLLGLAPFWMLSAGAAVVLCGVLFCLGYEPWAGMTVAVVALLLTGFVWWELPRYVRWCADRYAESLLSIAVTITKNAAPVKGD